MFSIYHSASTYILLPHLYLPVNLSVWFQSESYDAPRITSLQNPFIYLFIYLSDLIILQLIS